MLIYLCNDVVYVYGIMLQCIWYIMYVVIYIIVVRSIGVVLSGMCIVKLYVVMYQYIMLQCDMLLYGCVQFSGVCIVWYGIGMYWC